MCIFQINETPLHPASREGLLPVVQTMCAYGCQVDIVNKVNKAITLFDSIIQQYLRGESILFTEDTYCYIVCVCVCVCVFQDTYREATGTEHQHI